MDELLTDFLTETAENLAALDDAVLTLERVPGDPETIALVFRLVHTIKGTCGFLALPRLERVAHAAEDLLAAIRAGERHATAGLITVVLAALDRIRLIVDGLVANGAEPAGDDTALLAELQAAEDASELAADSNAVAEPDHATGDRSAAGGQPAQSIRLGVDVLENLMTLVSELVLTRNQLMQLARTEGDSRFTAPLQRLSHLTSDLQEGVVKTRMQPIMQAWRKLPRLVRDLGAELGKQVELSMIGGETELDRQVLELIQDPFVHMVRNSVDHGLEPPAARIAAGKPATGRITLGSYHEGGHIVIEVGDDGAGLSTEAIRARVLSRGLATAGELASMTERQLHLFIFRPGFSTAAAVTAVSGRGVGMDVVKANVERLGGTVDLRSVTGGGTTFIVKIPLTLAIISALIVAAQDQRFALPQLCVRELVRAEAQGTPGQGRLVVERVDGAPVLRLRERLLPLVSLRALLKMPPAPDAKPGEALTVVVATLCGATIGLVVDRVFDTEEIVVKPVSPLLRSIAIFGGSTILGDGSVIMILDPGGIARAIGQADTAAKEAAAQGGERLARRLGDRSAMLLVRLSSDASPVAIPLGLVARIESLPRAEIEHVSGRAVAQYRGRLMPLIALDGHTLTAGEVPVLVFSDRGRTVGLMTEEIVDVVEDLLDIELSSSRPGLLGTAVIAGRITEVIDTGQLLKQGLADWFVDDPVRDSGRRQRLLVVEDSAFFRQLLIPTLSAAGYNVTAVESAAKALALRDGARVAEFDAIVSDVEMPGMDGLQFARVVTADGSWQHTPLVALSSRCNPIDIRRGLAAGFRAYVGKFDRDALLDALRQQLEMAERQAA